MGSPFPGMDPYLEAHWGDVHARLIVYSSDALQRQMPGGLLVRAEEHVSVGQGEGAVRGFYPDVRISERDSTATEPTSPGHAAVAEPQVFPINIEPRTQRSLRIYDTSTGDRLITAIEFISPSNKDGEIGTKSYCNKRELFTAGDVNFVEIDLLRTGRYILAAPTGLTRNLDQLPAYGASVFRSQKPKVIEWYPMELRQRLPTILIPLRPTDADATLDLQALIEAAYDNGGYKRTNYRREPIPPLKEADARWANELLKERGARE
jgi:hypothetical protein